MVGALNGGSGGEPHLGVIRDPSHTQETKSGITDSL